MGEFLVETSHLFRYYCKSHRDLTLDEFTMPFRGRHRARCYNPSKPERYHLKGYSLNEAKTGYCISFFMYEGRDEKRPPGVSATTWPTVKMVGRDEALHNRGYILWADNWFSGLPAVRTCIDAGVEYAGTCRQDRLGAYSTKGMTVAEKKTHKEAEKLEKKGWKRGDYRAKETTIAGTQVYAMQWQDSNVVSFISTIKPVVGQTTRKAVDKKTRKYTLTPITILSVYSAYNFGKVGTDRMDQMVALYYRNTKHRWHVKLFIHLAYMCLNNAQVTYNDTHPFNRLSFLEFILAVIEELKPAPKNPRNDPHAHSRAGIHTPFHNHTKNRGKGDVKERDRQRGMCAQCKKSRSMYSCVECGVYLHINGGASDHSCWSEWHSEHQ